MAEQKDKKDAYSIDGLEDFSALNNKPRSKFALLDDRLKEKLAFHRRLYEIMLEKRDVPYSTFEIKLHMRSFLTRLV